MAASVLAWRSPVTWWSCRAAASSRTARGPGKGSSFRIELPVDAGDPLDERGLLRSVATAARALAVPQLQGIRILAVDDDRDALALVREILEATGATVFTADSAQQALETLERTTPDVLLTDLGMPQMSGFELIERVRHAERAEIREIPAVALTAYARSEDRAKSLRSGFQMHLAKPIDPGELMAAIASLVGRANAIE